MTVAVPNDPVAVARQLAAGFAETAAARDRAGGTPRAERAAIRASGLLKLTVPAGRGGPGTDWPTVYRTIRAIGEGDASLAQVYGFQHVLVATCELFGTPAQADRYVGGTARSNWFWGNALNPLDRRLALASTPAGLRLRGRKSYSTGATDADMLIVSALEEGTGKLIVAALPAGRAGIIIRDDWDCMGQRQTDSGTTDFEDVAVEPAEILGPPGPLGSPFASLRPCIAQLVFVNVYLGIAASAMAEAGRYVRTQGRPWIGSGVDRLEQDPYVLEHFGRMHAELAGATEAAERAARLLDEGWKLRDGITPDGRGDVAIAVAAAKVLATRACLEITSRAFETMGAGATAGKWNFDRHWRNARTLTLHDRLDYKLRELGEWALIGKRPTPSFYS